MTDPTGEDLEPKTPLDIVIKLHDVKVMQIKQTANNALIKLLEEGRYGENTASHVEQVEVSSLQKEFYRFKRELHDRGLLAEGVYTEK